jgi:hypothetical protein
MSELKITIDDYEFELITYDPLILYGRGLLKVKSKNISTKEELFFYCYRTISGVGIWRLACSFYVDVKAGTIGRLEKGDDYMVSNTIDLRLQKFIYEKLSKIPQVPITVTEELRAQLSDWEIRTLLYQQEERNMHIQIIEPELFKSLPDWKCGTALYGETSVAVILSKASELLEANYEIDGEPQYLFNYTNKLDLGLSGWEDDGKNRIMFITFNAYSIKLKRKDGSGKNLNFHYMNYSLAGDREYTHKGSLVYDFIVKDFFAPLCFTLDDTKINKYGLYDKFVSVSYYVCKIFEYKDQFADQSYSIDTEYSYIGHIYRNLFPYNLLSKMPRIPLINLEDLRLSYRAEKLEKEKIVEHEGGSYKIKKYVDKLIKTKDMDKIMVYLNKLKQYK